MTSHCAGTVQMREESERGIRKWEEMWFKMTAEDGERGGSSDMRWKTVHQTSGCNRKRSVTDSGQTSTSNVQRRWWGRTYSRRLASVSAGRRSSSHKYVGARRVDVCTPDQRPCRRCVQKPSASEVGTAAVWCGRTSTTRIPAWRLHSIPTEVAAEGTWECCCTRGTSNNFYMADFQEMLIDRLSRSSRNHSAFHYLWTFLHIFLINIITCLDDVCNTMVVLVYFGLHAAWDAKNTILHQFIINHQ